MRVSDLAREYAKGYVHFLIDRDISISSRDAYSLFRYTMYRLYGFSCGGLPISVESNYLECKEYLEGVRNSVEVSDSVDIRAVIDCSCVYALVSIQYCVGNIRARLVDV